MRFALVALLAGSGCLPVRRSPGEEAPPPSAATEWPAVYSQAMTAARESRQPDAERSLAEFASRFPGSPEAAEVPYWRALFKLDPANPAALRESIALLEAYLANTPSGTHVAEATALRRLGLALEQRNAALAAIPPAGVPRPEDKVRDDEIQKLREELSKANAELDRIRRRVSRPRP